MWPLEYLIKKLPVPTERATVSIFFLRKPPCCAHIAVYCTVPSLHNIQNRCTITTGYIRLHVSAVTRPSSGQQGMVLIKVHPLAFSNRIPLFTLKTCKLMSNVLMVKMLLNLKLSIKCITFEFPPARMDWQYGVPQSVVTLCWIVYECTWGRGSFTLSIN